jgi:cell division protein FtsB
MAIFVGAYAWMAFRGPEGIPSLLGKWDEIRSLQVENANLSQEVEQYEVRIERLTKSQEEQELEFRKRLDMMKPGELQFKLQGKPAPSEVPPAPTATEQ